MKCGTLQKKALGNTPACWVGMTLIELLVAMSILAILTIMGYKAFSALLIARQHLMETSRTWLDVSGAFRRMEWDIRSTSGAQIPLFQRLAHSSIVLQQTQTGQILTLYHFSARYPSGKEQIVYDASRAGLTWMAMEEGKSGGKIYPLLDAQAKVRWQILSQNQQWVSVWPPVNSQKQAFDNRAVALQMDIDLPGSEHVKRIWALP